MGAAWLCREFKTVLRDWTCPRSAENSSAYGGESAAQHRPFHHGDCENGAYFIRVFKRTYVLTFRDRIANSLPKLTDKIAFTPMSLDFSSHKNQRFYETTDEDALALLRVSDGRQDDLPILFG